jgi:hypothetical protein
VNSVEQKPSGAVFIDVANFLGADISNLLEAVDSMFKREVSRAYADFSRPIFRQIAFDLYAQGFDMIFCPSWNINNGCDGEEVKTKQTDDRVLERHLRDVAEERPDITEFIIAGVDADFIPAALAARGMGKNIYWVDHGGAGKVGHVLPRCPFNVIRLRPVELYQPQSDPELEERVIGEFARLERQHPFITLRFAAQNIGQMEERDVEQVIVSLQREGLIKSYEYTHPIKGNAFSALKLERQHPRVRAILDGDSYPLAG